MTKYLFRDRAQRDRVARALVPSEEMWPFIEGRQLPHDSVFQSARDRQIYGLAYEVFRGQLSFHSLHSLEPDVLVAAGSLLVALGNGHDDIDEWLTMYEAQAGVSRAST
jgi:hypothetical protein